MSQASEVYARLLLPKRLGFPLWNPAPDDNLVVEYREKGVNIGDVGLITSDGEFDFLFNICIPSDHAINQYGVPANFEDVSGSIQVSKNTKHHPPGTNIASNSKEDKAIDTSVAIQDNPNIPVGAGGGFSFTFSTSEGAILLMPEGGSQENLRDKGTFMDQALKHGLAWYEYANVTRRRLAENGSLYLVTGCDKTTSWGIASFSNSSGSNQVSLKFTVAQLASGNASRSYKWETSSPATVRYGPVIDDQDESQQNVLEPRADASNSRGRTRKRRGKGGQRIEESEIHDAVQNRPSITPHQRLQNQCVLVRGYRISIRPATLAKLKGPLKVSAIQDADSGDIFNRSGASIPFKDGVGGKQSWFGSIMGRIGGGSGGPRAHKSPDQTPSEQDVFLASVPNNSEIYYPSVAINNYLLETVPDAQVAVTHDSEWWNLCGDDDDFLDAGKLISRLEDMYRPSTQAGGIFLVPKEQDKTLGFLGEDQGVETKVNKKNKAMNETFIIVRPPPAKSNHPLNLQIQLVPPSNRKDQEARDPQSVDLPHSSLSVEDHDARGSMVAQSVADSGYGSSNTLRTGIGQTSRSVGRRMIIPLYNLQAHNVMTNAVVDAGTDAKVARYLVRGVEIAGVAILEPTEVWEEPGSNSGALRKLDDRDMVLHDTANVPIIAFPAAETTAATFSAQDHILQPSHVTSPSRPSLLHSLDNPPTGAKKFMSKLIRRNSGPASIALASPDTASPLRSGINVMSTSSPRFYQRFSLSRKPSRSSGSSVVRSSVSSPPPVPEATSDSGTNTPRAATVLGVQPMILSQRQPARGRPSKYIWDIRRWLKTAKIDIMSGIIGKLNAIGKDVDPDGTTKGSVLVRFEWTRGNPRPVPGRAIGSGQVGRSGAGIRYGSIDGSSSPGTTLVNHSVSGDNLGSSSRWRSNGSQDSVSATYVGGSDQLDIQEEDGNDSDSEDSETAWICTLLVQHATHATEPVNVSYEPQIDRGKMIRLKVATLSPTPHHPKVISMMKVIFPLPDIAVDKIEVLPREQTPSGIPHPSKHQGLILSAEEIKDVVSCTALWLIVRESIGGIGKVSRKGAGWRILS